MTEIIDRAAALDFLAFDHRASIVGFLNSQANKFELSGQREAAAALRATGSSIAAQIDITVGSPGIASPVDAIILEACAQFGGVNHAEITCHDPGAAPVQRVRFAAIWIAKRRLNWGDSELGKHFHRERTTINHSVKRAEEIRAADEQFKEITDALTAREFRCETCQASIVPAREGGKA